jgi:CheY-like chemotaxis protein
MERGQKTIQKKRILLVEDQVDMRELIKLCLDAHEVIEANNGAEAIPLVAQSRFDLVMTDHRMPLMTGSELADRIKKMVPAQPILMITGNHTALSEAVDAVLRKPFAVENLRTAVDKILLATDNAAA